MLNRVVLTMHNFSFCKQHKELLRSGKLSHQSPTSKHRNDSGTGFSFTSAVSYAGTPPAAESHGSLVGAVGAAESRYMERY